MSAQSTAALKFHNAGPSNIAAVTPGATVLDCTWVGTAADTTIDVTNHDGSTCAGVPIIAGWTRMNIKAITATAGTVFAGW